MQKQPNILIKFKGATLIETLAAVAIFSILIGAMSGLIISAVQNQSRILSSQQLLDQISYALEYMGRSIRMARKELLCEDPLDNNKPCCLRSAGYGFNYETKPGVIRFLDENQRCHQFFLSESKILYEITSTDNTDKNFEDAQILVPLSSPELEVASLNFGISGQDQADNLQPRVTIFLEIIGKETQLARPKINLQTTISQRTLDVQR